MSWLSFKVFIYDLLWGLFGWGPVSIFDNKQVWHMAGGYLISHLSSLFLKRYYWVVCVFAAIGKELLDHFVFGCGSNELKHVLDVSVWFIGGLSYYIIVILKRKKYGYEK